MASRISTRLTIGVAAIVAFIGGLVVAGGFNLTPFGYAQQAGGGAKPPQAAVQQVTEASNAFVAIAEHVTPAVVSIQMERQARPVRVPCRAGLGIRPPGAGRVPGRAAGQRGPGVLRDGGRKDDQQRAEGQRGAD